MQDISSHVFDGGWFWACFFLLVLGMGAARVFCGNARLMKTLLYASAQAAFLLVGLRIPVVALAAWLAFGVLSYGLVKASQENLVWPLWALILTVFRGMAWLHPTPLGKWLVVLFGLSYMALRAIAFATDYRNGKIARPSLLVFLTYLLFVPSIAAGPIARYDHFAAQAEGEAIVDSNAILEAVERIACGAFKKFFLAGLLSNWMLPSKISAAAILSITQSWIGLYAYAWYLYLDFSAYTDFAIGAGLLLGVRLPENFRWPYFSRNIIDFWNRWHISLSLWLRDYIFMPVGQWLFRQSILDASPLLIALISYIVTMVFCGAWHGFPWHYLAWGLYHGLGLFVCRAVRTWEQRHRSHPLIQAWNTHRLGALVSATLTFHFVALGWLLFVYDIPTAGKVFIKLIHGGVS